MVLFHKELSPEPTETASSVDRGEMVASYGSFESTYEASEYDEEILSHVTSRIENFTTKGSYQLELVACHLKHWFATSQHQVLTRSVQSLAEDDIQVLDVTFPQKRRVVFLCYNRTGPSEDGMHFLSLHSISNNPRHIKALDILIVVTRDSQSKEAISWQLPMFPHRFKEVVYVNYSYGSKPVSSIDCIKKLYVAMSFGFSMLLEYPKRGSSVIECITDWNSVDRRETCPKAMSRAQQLRKMEFFSRGPPLEATVYASSALEPCFNMTFGLRSIRPTLPQLPRLPMIMDNEMAAYAFDLSVPTLIHQGTVLNTRVLSIVILVAVSLCLLSEAPSSDTLLALLCTVSSSGGCSDELKKKVAVAAFAWILGNMFFAQILVDDMTSSITAPDNSRIPRLQNCISPRIYKHSGSLYLGLNPDTFLSFLGRVDRIWGSMDPLICGTASDADQVRRFLNVQNLYRVKVDEYDGQWLFNAYSQRRHVICPRESSATSCGIVWSILDNSEWNDYVSILLRHDLMKHPFRQHTRRKLRSHGRSLKRYHGCCENRRNISKGLSILLAELQPKQPGTSDTQDDFPFLFVVIGSCAALLSFTIEFLISGIACVLSKHILAARHVLDRFRELKFRRHPRRVAQCPQGDSGAAAVMSSTSFHGVREAFPA